MAGTSTCGWSPVGSVVSGFVIGLRGGFWGQRLRQHATQGRAITPEACHRVLQVGVGYAAGNSVTGKFNLAEGGFAGQTVTGNFNTAEGSDSGSTVSGSANTAVGDLSGNMP